MTDLRRQAPELAVSNVRVVSRDQAVRDARLVLDDYERRYGVGSERLVEAFTDESGRVHETGAYHQWRAMLERWRQLSAPPPAI